MPKTDNEAHDEARRQWLLKRQAYARIEWLRKRQAYLREQYRAGPLPTKALVEELENIHAELKRNERSNGS